MYPRKGEALCDFARRLSQGITNLSAWLLLAPVTDRQTNRSFLEPGLYILLHLFFRKLIHTELFFQSGLWSAP